MAGDVVEEALGFDAVLHHEPAQGGAVALVVVLLHAERLRGRNLEIAGDVVADARVHLLPEIDVVGIERVVEIEDPGLDGGEVGPRRGLNRDHG